MAAASAILAKVLASGAAGTAAGAGTTAGATGAAGTAAGATGAGTAAAGAGTGAGMAGAAGAAGANGMGAVLSSASKAVPTAKAAGGTVQSAGASPALLAPKTVATGANKDIVSKPAQTGSGQGNLSQSDSQPPPAVQLPRSPRLFERLPKSGLVQAAPPFVPSPVSIQRPSPSTTLQDILAAARRA